MRSLRQPRIRYARQWVVSACRQTCFCQSAGADLVEGAGKHCGGHLIYRLSAVFLTAVSLWGQGGLGYGGPAVSSRGLRQAGARAGEAVTIRPYATVRGVYDNGLISTGLNSRGEIVNPGGLFGVEAQVGAYGAKEWKRTRIGMDYEGLYRHYSRATFYNGSDHMLDMDITRQVTRRSYFRLRGLGGTTSRPVGGLFTFSNVDPSFFGVPSSEIFDSRTYFADVMGQYIVSLDSRNSVSFMGNGFAVRRRSRALIGMNGHRAMGDFSRRITRRTSIGFAYQYLHFDFPRVFGESDIHLTMVQFSRLFSRNWRLSTSFGGYRVDLSGVRQVKLDPLVAALFGQTEGREAFNSVNWLPSGEFNLTREMRRSTLVFSFTSGPSGGGGVFLTSRQQQGGVTFGYRGSEKWSFSVSSGYQTYSGLGAYRGNINTMIGGGLISRRITGDLYLNGSYDFRRFNVDNGIVQSFKRNSSRLMGGFTYSPGSIPVSLR